MVSIRSRLAKRLVLAIGMRRRLAALADVEGDDAAFRQMVEKLRSADRRRPSRSVQRTWTTTHLECDGHDLFVMSKGDSRASRAILYLHGGGFQFGPFASEWAAMQRVAADTGADLAMFLYPRAPESTAPNTLRVTQAAYQQVLDMYGAGNVVVIGTSAGGGLALALMVELRDAGLPLPSCAVLFSPSVDMTLREDVSDLEDGDALLSVAYVRSAGRVYAGALGPDHPIVSPINADVGGLPPTVVFVGGSEIFLPSIESFVEVAHRAGTEVTLIHGEDGQHTWPIGPTPEGRKALDRVADIVRACR